MLDIAVLPYLGMLLRRLALPRGRSTMNVAPWIVQGLRAVAHPA